MGCYYFSNLYTLWDLYIKFWRPVSSARGLETEKKKEKKTDPEDLTTERNVNVWGLGS